MELKIKTPGKRVKAYYNRAYYGGITLSVYDENMTGSPVATLGYDNANKKMVLYVRNLKAENIELIVEEELDATIPNSEKKYRIKPEYLDKWGSDAMPDTIVTYSDVEMIARGWEMNVNELIDQLIEGN